MIAQVRECGARVTLITDGDIAGVIHTTDPSTGIDLYLGTGGAPEGVLLLLPCVAQVARCKVGSYSMATNRKNVSQNGHY